MNLDAELSLTSPESNLMVELLPGFWAPDNFHVNVMVQCLVDLSTAIRIFHNRKTSSLHYQLEIVGVIGMYNVFLWMSLVVM